MTVPLDSQEPRVSEVMMVLMVPVDSQEDRYIYDFFFFFYFSVDSLDNTVKYLESQR